MATAYYAANYKVPTQFRAPFAGVSICREFSFNVGVALIVNDTITLLKLPAGACLENWLIDTPELDSGTDAITLDLGDGTTQDRWIAASTIGQAGGKISGLADGAAASLPCSVGSTALDMILTVKVAPNVGTTPTISIRGWARYHFSSLTLPAASA
jgi:hypothetical protein